MPTCLSMLRPVRLHARSKRCCEVAAPCDKLNTVGGIQFGTLALAAHAFEAGDDRIGRRDLNKDMKMKRGPPVRRRSAGSRVDSAVGFGIPGWVICDVLVGTFPELHVQDGSPSSMPFERPSPSESALHNDFVHLCPSAAKAIPKGSLAPPPL